MSNQHCRSNRQLCCLFGSTMLLLWATMSKQRSTLSKGRNFNAKLVRHCCRFWQQSRTLLRHCCWCGPGFTVWWRWRWWRRWFILSVCKIRKRHYANFGGAYTEFQANTEEQCVLECAKRYSECTAVDFNIHTNACTGHRDQTGAGHWQSNTCCNRHEIIGCGT